VLIAMAIPSASRLAAVASEPTSRLFASRRGAVIQSMRRWWRVERNAAARCSHSIATSG
jgi:hypothetical protein